MNDFLKQHKWTLLGLFVVLLMFMMVAFVKQADDLVRSRQAQQQGYATGEVDIGGPFVMTSTTGEQVDESALLGRYTILFFGYTHCPDVCPGTFSLLSGVYNKLDKSEQDKLDVVFVSVDAKRDTPESLKDYVAAFHPDFSGFGGTEEQVRQMADAWKVYYVIHEPENPADPDFYVVDHSGFLYLMGPDGKYLRHWSHKTDISQLHDDLAEIL